MLVVPRTAEPRCPTACTAPTATAATAAMASPTVLTFDAEGRAVDFDVWVDDLQLFLQCDSRDGVSLFHHTSGVSTAPAATADSTVRSEWTTRDAIARLAVRSHLPSAERAHFGQYKTAQSLYDAVVARYSSPATAALSRLMLPYLFPDLATFATLADLITHLRTSDTRYRAALPTELCAKNPPPPMYITLHYLVTRLPDSLASVMDHFLFLCPTELTVDLLEERLTAAEKSILAVGASRGDRRTPFFEGCSPVPLLPSVASTAAVDLVGTEEVGAASAPSGRRRNSKGKGGKGGGGDGWGGGGDGGGGGGGCGGGGGGGGSGGFGGGSGGGGDSDSGGGGSGSGGGGGGGGGARRGAAAQRGGFGGSQHQSGGAGPCTYVLRTGGGRGETCGLPHTAQRCFGRLSDAWCALFPDAVELPHWGDLLKQNVAIFYLDFDAILAAMYAVTDSAEGDCYLSVPPDPGIKAAALGASVSAAPGTGESAAPGAGEFSTPNAGESALFRSAPTEALHTFTLDSAASRSFFRDSTTLTPLSRPVAVSLADPSGGPVLAHSSTVLPCPAAPSGLLSGLHLPSFSTNLVSGADLQDAWVDQFTPRGQRVTHCTCSWTGRHLATFTRRPGLSLYTLTTMSPPVTASSQVFAVASRSSPASVPCSFRPLSHETLLWHHRLGHPSLPRLRGMASRTLVSGLPRCLPPLPPGPAPTCVPCVEGRQRAAPHSSEFPPKEAPLQTLHMDVGGPARVHRGGEFSSDLLRAFCRAEGIRQTFTLPTSPQQNGIAERRIGMVMDVAHTSMIHAAAPHFLWPFAVQYAAHQINLQPRVSLPETTPTLRWTGKVGDASVFRVWGSRAFVRDTSADKLSSCAVPCVFLGFPPYAPGWQFYHPTSRRVLSSQDVTFYKSVSYYHPVELVKVAIDSGAARGAEPAGAGTGGAKPGGAEPERVESGGAESGRAEPGGAEPERVEPGCTASGGAEPARAESRGSPGVPLRQEPLSPQQLREWYARRCRGAAGAGGAAGAAGDAARAAGGTTGAGPAGGDAGARAAGAAGGATGAARGAPGTGAAEGTSGAAGGAAGTGATGGAAGPRAAGGATAARAAGAAGVTGVVGGPGGSGAAGGAVAAGPGGARTGGTGAAGTGGAAGVVAGDPGAEGAGAVSAVSRGAAQPRPYYVPLLQRVLGLPPSPGPTPPLLSPPPVKSQSQLQLASPLPGPSPYFGLTRGLTERCEPESRPVSPESRLASRASRFALPDRTVRAGRCVSRPRPPPVPSTHSMTLHPSTTPQRVPLPSPLASSLPDGPDLESDSLHTASPAVMRFLATVVTGPLFESTDASALVTELVDFAAHCRLEYATSLVAESVSASVCPPSVGGECALGTDVLEDRQEEFECFAAALPHLVSMLLAPEGDPDAPDIPTPRSYAEAIEGPYSSQWQAAMDVKMASWKSTGTYVNEVPPPGANIVSSMWIFRVKRPLGSPPVFKARYVAHGFSQRQGVDFFHTFSPTPKMTTLWVLLHVAALRDYELHSLDFSTAFLQGSLHEEIWLRRPPGFTGSFPADTQWSLQRPVYGQAPHEWHDTLRTTLAPLGFAPSTAKPSLFLRTDTLCRRSTFSSQCTITLTQSHMVQQVLQRFGFMYSSPQFTPLPTSHSLSAPPSDESVEPSGPYPERVGCLMYLMTCTRPDLAYPLSLLARYVAPGRHRKLHWDAAKRVLRYLCSTSGMGLVLGGRARVVLTGHADASWVDNLATQRSSQGYTFSLGSGSVSWRSIRSSSVLSSSCEAEIYAGAMAAQELRWLTYLLTDLGEAPRSPPVLYVDNKAMLALCQEQRVEHITKHIALRYFLARELHQRGQLRLAYVASQIDVFTKALQPCNHQPCFAFLD
ncbi:unnamed protein product [Closterium sp. NIES-53]